MQIIPIMPIETMFGMVNRRAGYLLTFCLFYIKSIQKICICQKKVVSLQRFLKKGVYYTLFGT